MTGRGKGQLFAVPLFRMGNFFEIWMGTLSKKLTTC